MSKTQKLTLIVAACRLPVVSLPRSCAAQTPSEITGEWHGTWSYSGTYSSLDGSVNFSGGGPATLEIGVGNGMAEMEFGGPIPYYEGLSGLFMTSNEAQFDATSASGTAPGYTSRTGAVFGNFFVTYESLLPDGTIVDPQTAVADLTVVVRDPSSDAELDAFATFVAVIPEPPSGVLAAAAAMVIGAVAEVRAALRKSKSRPSSATL